MMTFALAARNLERNRRRSITTLAAIIVGAVAILLFGGYTRNIRYGLQMGFVRSSGHLQIQHKDYFLYGSGDPAAYGIADYERIMEVVRHDPVRRRCSRSSHRRCSSAASPAISMRESPAP